MLRPTFPFSSLDAHLARYLTYFSGGSPLPPLMEAERHTVCDTVVCGIVYSTQQNRSNDSGIWSNDVRFSLHENVWFV